LNGIRKLLAYANTVNISLLRWKVKLSLCFIKHHDIKTLGSGSIAPCIRNLGTRWRWVVSFTPRPFYHRGEPPVAFG
jgi:hypothetical protein